MLIQKYLCHGSQHLGRALYKDCLKVGKSSKKSATIVSKDQFVAGSQKLVQLIGDNNLLTYYVGVSWLPIISLHSHSNRCCTN